MNCFCSGVALANNKSVTPSSSVALSDRQRMAAINSAWLPAGNAWPPPGTPGRNTWPSDRAAETTPRSPSKGTAYVEENPGRSIDF